MQAMGTIPYILDLYFTKDDATFSCFALELLSSNPNLRTLKGISMDLESAIFNGFKKMISNLWSGIRVKYSNFQNIYYYHLPNIY